MKNNKTRNTNGGRSQDRMGRTKAHTQFPNPIFEDGCWAPSEGSSCCKSVHGSHPGGDSISDMGLEPILVFPSGPRARTVPWSPYTWARAKPRRLQWRLHWG